MSFHPYVLVSLVQEGTLCAIKGETYIHQASNKPLIYNDVLPARYATAMAVGVITSILFDFRFTPQDGIHIQHFLGDQEFETRESRDVG